MDEQQDKNKKEIISNIKFYFLWLCAAILFCCIFLYIVDNFPFKKNLFRYQILSTILGYLIITVSLFLIFLVIFLVPKFLGSIVDYIDNLRGKYLSDKLLESSKYAIKIVDDNCIRISFGSEFQILKISDIKIIGELTTSGGPISDDWFLVFVMNKETWYQISMYSENIKEVLKELSQLLKAEIFGTLFYSTSWKTNVIYPKDAQGKELFLSEGNFINKRLILNSELNEFF